MLFVKLKLAESASLVAPPANDGAPPPAGASSSNDGAPPAGPGGMNWNDLVADGIAGEPNSGRADDGAPPANDTVVNVQVAPPMMDKVSATSDAGMGSFPSRYAYMFVFFVCAQGI